MRLNDLLFTGMDITNETRKLIKKTLNNDAMTENERKAYALGVENTLSALEAILDSDENLIVHEAGLGLPTEYDINDLIELCEEKEEYFYE